MAKIRVYLDYNIYTQLADKNIVLPQEALQYVQFYISVAHAEEFYNAKKNDKENNNFEQLNAVENLLTRELNNKGVLNPTPNSRILNKQEDFSDSLRRVKEYDTDSFIKESASIMFNQYQDTYENLREKNRKVLNFSSLSAKEIWLQKEVCEELTNFENEVTEMNQALYSVLKRPYGVITAYVLSKSQSFKPFRLTKDIYKGKRPRFKEIEFVIEFLQNVLNKCGYYKDKTERTVKSGIYDTEHAIYATYCTYFVTDDRRLSNRMNAIYYYLGLETTCISFDEWCLLLQRLKCN